MKITNIFPLEGLVAVIVVVEGLVNNHDQLEYRLAPKRYHRKVRSKLPDFSPAAATKEKEDSLTSFTFPPLSNFTFDETLTSSSSGGNSSFLLDLPYPSHFIYSLQLLNLSLPFLGEGVTVPEDPPIPQIDIQDVLNNTQYFQPDNRRTPSENKPPLTEDARPSGGRRSVNRYRNRVPAHLRHLPKRSLEDDAPDVSKSTVSRNLNASTSIRRRQEFHAKLRATTTTKPGLTKKLLYRRANATNKSNKIKAQIELLSTTSRPTRREALEQESASTQQYETSFTRPGVILDSDNKRTKISGFVFTRDNKRQTFTVKPPQVSSGFVPFIPQFTTQRDRSTTTELSVDLSSHRDGHSKNAPSSEFSRFELPVKNGNNAQPLSASESTQIQKPDTFTVKGEAPVNKDDLTLSATTTSLPFTEVVLNFTFPSFELPNPDGSKPPPPTLPPPLSIEELIKKFTGKDPITDPPFVTTTANQLVEPTSFTPGRALSQTTNLTFKPEIKPFENLDETLKQLLGATEPKKEVTTQAAPTIELKFPQIPSPTKESVTTDANVFLSQFSLPTTETPKTEASKAASTSENPVTILAIPLNESDVTSSSTNKNQSISVGRGPLDVSSLDVAGGFPSGVSQGAFQQGSFQSQPASFNFQGFQQQQHQPSGNEYGGFQQNQGFQSASFGPADIAAGQQNPFYYASFPGAGQGQFQAGGFDGLLHYGPTGPPAGEYNAITQGLSLLASFGGGVGGVQQPSNFQQAPSFDFSAASLQSASQLQPTVNLPTQGFYAQGFPSFNIVQQPQASYQLVPNQQVPYQIVQQQSYQTPAQPSQQFQQVYPPSSQQQPYQLVASGNPTSTGYPSQLFQVQPQSAVIQTAGQSAHAGTAQLSINPAQFGTLLSGASLSGTVGASTGTASVTSLSASTSSVDTARSDKAPSSSRIVEVQLKPEAEQQTGESVPAASEIVEIIAIGPESSGMESRSSKKSYFKRGLRSGYYS